MLDEVFPQSTPFHAMFPLPSRTIWQFPRLRFTARSRLFWARNARLVSAVIAGIAPEHRGESIGVLLEEVARAKGAAAHEDKRSFDCAAAEVAAGVVAVLAREERGGEGGNPEQTVLRDVVIPFIDTELEGVSLEGTFDWWVCDISSVFVDVRHAFK